MKGQQRTIFAIGEILAALVVGVLFLGIATGYANSNVFSKQYLAKDSALMVDTLQAVPGNAYITYPGETERYQISVQEPNITVVEFPNDPYGARYAYVSSGFDVRGSVEYEELTFTKDSQGITIS